MDSNLQPNIENEHHRHNKTGRGSFGIMNINTDAVYEAAQGVVFDKATSFTYWDRVQLIVGAYAKLHPEEMKLTLKYNYERQANTFRKHGAGSNKNLELRHGMSLPPGLLRKLEEYDPELFTNPKLYHKFLKTFPGLCTFRN